MANGEQGQRPCFILRVLSFGFQVKWMVSKWEGLFSLSEGYPSKFETLLYLIKHSKLTFQKFFLLIILINQKLTTWKFSCWLAVFEVGRNSPCGNCHRSIEWYEHHEDHTKHFGINFLLLILFSTRGNILNCLTCDSIDIRVKNKNIVWFAA